MKFIYTLNLIIVLATFSHSQEILLLKEDGKVVIGDTSAITIPEGYSLYVQHGILTERVKVSLKETDDWSDNSFSKLPSIKEVEEVISNENHLLNMPSAESLVKSGYSVTEMDAKLLEQIEWLWMYTIELKKEILLLEQRINKEKIE